MSRLIDADLLVKNCKCTGKFEDNFNCVTLSDLRRIIEEQPTAFDMEKVLNELKHEESEALRRYSESKGTAYAFSDKCSWGNWAKAIEIVKRGGRDD